MVERHRVHTTTRHRAVRRLVTWGLSALLVLGGCGDGRTDDKMSLTDYIERLNALMAEVIPRGEELFASPQGAVLAEGARLADFTPLDLQIALEQIGEIETYVRDAVTAIDPPPEVEDFHEFYFDTRFASAREALAARAGTADSWEDLSETPEMTAYRTAVAVDKQTCVDFQADLDALRDRGVFADTPWIATDFRNIAQALLGCDTYPEKPEDMFRP
jgi:hypothetical protein